MKYILSGIVGVLLAASLTIGQAPPDQIGLDQLIKSRTETTLPGSGVVLVDATPRDVLHLADVECAVDDRVEINLNVHVQKAIPTPGGQSRLWIEHRPRIGGVFVPGAIRISVWEDYLDAGQKVKTPWSTTVTCTTDGERRFWLRGASWGSWLLVKPHVTRGEVVVYRGRTPGF